MAMTAATREHTHMTSAVGCRRVHDKSMSKMKVYRKSADAIMSADS